MNRCIYDSIFQEQTIGKLKIKNRIIMNTTETLYASATGEATIQLIEYYRRRAKGGVGMILLHSIQGNTKNDPNDPYAGSLRLDNNAFIPMLSDLTEAVHDEDCKIAALVSIGGGAKGAGESYISNMSTNRDSLKVAPSDYYQDGELVARGMTVDEIRETVKEYGKCALRAKQAGFDAFYIHALGSYLLAEFLSPLFNHRKDEYGGTPEKRWRILFELIDECRVQIGNQMPLIVRLSVDEMSPNGRNLEESLRLLKCLEQRGVDAFDVTAGLTDAMHRSLPPIYVPFGTNIPYIKKVKESVSVPIICSGRFTNPSDVNDVISKGIADFIGMGRGLIADPDWVNKVQNGKEDEIRQCLCCNNCIGQRIMRKLPLRCSINPYAGREWCESEDPKKTASPKKIAIIGGGPAGLEAARVLGLAGHEVFVYEKTEMLCGGQVYLSSVPVAKERMQNIPVYYKMALSKMSNVHVYLNYEVTNKNIKEIDASVFFVATGAEPLIPRIEGINGCNIYTAQEALKGKVVPDKRILIAGGGQIGVETAHYYATKGYDVTVVEMLETIAMQEEPITRGALMYLLEEANVKILSGWRITEFDNGVAHLESVQDAFKKQCVSYDTAIIAFGTKPIQNLYHILIDQGKHAVMIGDSKRISNVANAIHDGHVKALQYC